MPPLLPTLVQHVSSTRSHSVRGDTLDDAALLLPRTVPATVVRDRDICTCVHDKVGRLIGHCGTIDMNRVSRDQ
eukprot:m.1309184 g.1309184  ORF g.1309184 m.1309184 type:complete len:74 (+) comp24823_c0_seq14:2020-2241(+)